MNINKGTLVTIQLAVPLVFLEFRSALWDDLMVQSSEHSCYVLWLTLFVCAWNFPCSQQGESKSIFSFFTPSLPQTLIHQPGTIRCLTLIISCKSSQKSLPGTCPSLENSRLRVGTQLTRVTQLVMCRQHTFVVYCLAFNVNLSKYYGVNVLILAQDLVDFIIYKLHAMLRIIATLHRP